MPVKVDPLRVPPNLLPLNREGGESISVFHILSILQISIFIFSSQVGSGFFLLPALLSGGGYYSLLVIAIVGLCAIFIINAFAQSQKNVRELIEEGFGSRVSKFCFFIYWFISWFSTIVLFKELVGYLGIGGKNSLYLELTIWLCVTLLNMWKLKYTLYIESFLTIVKILPFFLLFISYILSIKSGPILQLEPIKVGLFVKCLWCFVGLETGSIISKTLNININDRKIGTYIGIFTVVSFYILSIFFSFKIVGNGVLVNNPAPYLTILNNGFYGIIAPHNIHLFVQSLIVLSLIGSINSWTISSGYTAEECANNNILPKFCAIKNMHQVPYVGLFLSSFLVLLFLLVCNNGNIYRVINMFIDISCCFFMAIYGLCLISYGRVYGKNFIGRFFYISLGLLLLMVFVHELYNYVAVVIKNIL